MEKLSHSYPFQATLSVMNMGEDLQQDIPDGWGGGGILPYSKVGKFHKPVAILGVFYFLYSRSPPSQHRKMRRKKHLPLQLDKHMNFKKMLKWVQSFGFWPDNKSE